MPNTQAPIVSSTCPARHRKAIIFCCDQGYLPFAAHAAAQITALNPVRDFDICFCFGDPALSLPNSLAHLGIRHVHVDVRDAFAGLRLDDGACKDVYLRMVLPQVFEDAYDRILYLDSDIFVQGGDFGALLDVDIADHVIAAVRNNTQWRTPQRLPKQFKVLDLPSAKYFNAGIMLMDVARYNDQRLLDRCLAFGVAHADKMLRHDQNLYNCVLQGNWAELSPMWNWQLGQSSSLFTLACEPNIVHFIGDDKPWNDPRGILSPRYANAMKHFSKVHFGEFQWPANRNQPTQVDSKTMRKALVKHLLSGHRSARYFRQFPNDMVVLT